MSTLTKNPNRKDDRKDEPTEKIVVVHVRERGNGRITSKVLRETPRVATSIRVAPAIMRYSYAASKQKSLAGTILSESKSSANRTKRGSFAPSKEELQSILDSWTKELDNESEWVTVD